MGRTTHAPPPGGGGYATRREAEAALTDLLDRFNKRTRVDAGRQTVGAYLEQWLAGKAALRSTPLTPATPPPIPPQERGIGRFRSMRENRAVPL